MSVSNVKRQVNPRENLLAFIVGTSGYTSADEGKPCKVHTVENEVRLLASTEEVEMQIYRVDTVNNIILCKGPGEVIQLTYTGVDLVRGLKHITGSATVGAVVEDSVLALGDVLRLVTNVDTTAKTIEIIL